MGYAFVIQTYSNISEVICYIPEHNGVNLMIAKAVLINAVVTHKPNQSWNKNSPFMIIIRLKTNLPSQIFYSSFTIIFVL